MERAKVFDTKRMVVLALMAAVAYACVALFRIPVVMFLKYEPKDCILAICGKLYGPLPALLTSFVVALLEMVTVSDTGPIGLLMNVLSTALFVCPAAFLYQRKRNLKSAVLGLLCGAVLMTVGMLFWNWLVTPWYMGMPRQAIVELLLPAFLPFNLLKAGLNGVLTVLLYKTVVTTLRKARLVPQTASVGNRKLGISVWVIGLIFLAILILILLAWQGVL
ncbi:MAG: ECF transporter S component [Clostridia bacterium]|nr:ECF transporter S component [Clostridia bacterium]